MSFTGDLEHLPIVDIIQLLHASRKSGTLTIRCRKGESQLVFIDGYIVCANHPNTSVRIGKILLEVGAITDAALDQALHKQWHAGEDRKPLIATLIEDGLLQAEDAYKGLQTLIEMTVVEILTWTRGSFSLDVDRTLVSDEYRYFPEQLHRDMNLDTQSVLMDALRIYDEKVRDGQLEPDHFEGGEELELAVADTGGSTMLTADDLGLGDLDQLEKKIPGVFQGLSAPSPLPDTVMGSAFAGEGLTAAEEEQLTTFLRQPSSLTPHERLSKPNQAVILFSPDPLFARAATAACAREGLLIFATTDPQDLEPIINQYLARQSMPILLLDRATSTPGCSAAELAELRRQYRQQFRHLPLVQLVAPSDYATMHDAYADGARIVLPRPLRAEQPATFINDFIGFLSALSTCVSQCRTATTATLPADRLTAVMAELRTATELSQVAMALLSHVAERFPRTLTLVVRPTELVAERGHGLENDGDGAGTPLGFRIPLGTDSVFDRVIAQGEPFFGSSLDQELCGTLHTAIGSPLETQVLLLPLQVRGQTVALTYGDFGAARPQPVEVAELAIVAKVAGLVAENVLYRKRLGKPATV